MLFKTKLLYLKERITLWESKLINLIKKNPPSINTDKGDYQFNYDLILKSISNIHTKQILLEIRNEIADQYDNEIRKQKLISDSKEKHSKNHIIALRNTQKLLNNLNIIDLAIRNISDIEKQVKHHLKEKLKLEEIEVFPNIKK